MIKERNGTYYVTIVNDFTNPNFATEIYNWAISNDIYFVVIEWRDKVTLSLKTEMLAIEALMRFT